MILYGVMSDSSIVQLFVAGVIPGVMGGLGLMLVVQLRSQNSVRQITRTNEWEFVIADLVDSNMRLREEVNTLQEQVESLRDVEGGGVMLQSLVDEVNHLRIANGLVEVSGPGIAVEMSDPISVLDLYDLINELRNAGRSPLPRQPPLRIGSQPRRSRAIGNGGFRRLASASVAVPSRRSPCLRRGVMRVNSGCVT